MSFIEEVLDCLGVSNCPYRYVILGGNGGYFEGIKSILSFSSEKIILSLSKGRIIIEGDKLNIKKYSAGDVCVDGSIMRVINE